MEWCKSHWDMLRENVKEQGIYNWVAESGKTAALQIQDQVERGELTAVNYDPLMNCYWMIFDRTMAMVGLYALSEDFGCPICFFNKQRTEDGRCACGQDSCEAKEPGTIPPFETWLEETPVACKQFMVEQGWI